MTENMRHEDPRVLWKVPVLFENDWTALYLARALSPSLGRPLFDIAYGCPLCAWSGGRTPLVTWNLTADEVRDHLTAYAEVGATCAMTFTRQDVSRCLDDPYCDMLLELLGEFGGQAIICDDRLAHHIRATHPDIRLVCSNNRCVVDRWEGFMGKDETTYYHDLLGLYDEVVVRTEALLEGGIADELVDVCDNVEVLVNQDCARECTMAPKHIAHVAETIEHLTQDLTDRQVRHCLLGLSHAQDETIYVSNERRRELADMGFIRFKLDGRGINPMGLARYLILETLHNGAELMRNDEMHRLLAPVAWLSRAALDPSDQVAIPRGEAIQPAGSSGGKSFSRSGASPAADRS